METRFRVPFFKGLFLGVAVLVAVQLIIGFIHVVFGFTVLYESLSTNALSFTPLFYGF